MATQMRASAPVISQQGPLPQDLSRVVAAQIGETAGKVWHYLQKNGQATPAEIAQKTACPQDMVQRAIGWLAREDKLAIAKMGRDELISLR
jgi:hypothetical protein